MERADGFLMLGKIGIQPFRIFKRRIEENLMETIDLIAPRLGTVLLWLGVGHTNW